MYRSRTAEAVVLAAGLGSRMRAGGYKDPKPLVDLLGRPLLWWTLTGLEMAGIRKIIVVTGNRAAEISAWIAGECWAADIDIVFNPDFRHGNGVSAKYGMDSVSSTHAILTMADHIVEQSIYRAAMSGSRREDLRLVVDFEPTLRAQLDEPTRVLVDERGRIIDIGKEIDSWNCVDTGVFQIGPAFRDAAEEVMRAGDGYYTVTQIVRHMIADEMILRGVDSAGRFWLDIDTSDDLRTAERILSSSPHVIEAFGPRLEAVSPSGAEIANR